MSTPTSVVVSSCEYWMRIAISLHLCVKKALLDILHDPNINGLPRGEQQLFQRLHQFKQNQQHHLRNVIKPFQWEKLCHTCSSNCPNHCPHQGRTNSEDLDTTCIVVLIINLTTLPPPQDGWKKDPNPNDVSKAAFVLRARQLRNDINHCALEDTSTEQEFNSYWQRVENILVGLQFNDMISFHNLKETSLDPKTDAKITALYDRSNSLVNDMADQKQDIGVLHKAVNDMKIQLDGLHLEDALTQQQDNLQQLKENIKCMESMEKRLRNTECSIEKLKKTQRTFIQQNERIISCMENAVYQQDASDEQASESSKQLKKSSQKRYSNIFVTFEYSPSDLPKQNRREDMAVGLSLIKNATKAFSQEADRSALDGPSLESQGTMLRKKIPEKMRDELIELSFQETDYNDIVTSPNDYVIISGAPGCGKSTLCETLAYKWSCGEMWAVNPQFEFVFVLKFRDLNRFKDDKNITAQKILSHSYPEQFNKISTMQSASNALLILDGFDECSNKFELLKDDDKFTRYTHALFDLLDPRNKFLPSARIVTCRPASREILIRLLVSKDFRPTCTFEIVGFNITNLEKYIRQYSHHASLDRSNQNQKEEEKKEKLEEFITRVKRTPILQSMMTIPFYCNGVCCLMLESEIAVDSIPMTYTGLFSTLLTLFLRNHGFRNTKMKLKHVLEKKKFKKMILLLSQFAFSMEQEGKIVFSTNDFPKSDVRKLRNAEQLIIRSGLIMKVDREDEVSYQFLHYFFHEFLVALHVYHNGMNTAESCYSGYILSMLGGLIGGAVDSSKSNRFVRKYALKFKPEKSISIEQILKQSPTEYYISSSLSIVFEFQNYLHLKSSTAIVINSFNIDQRHSEYILDMSRRKDMKINELSLIIMDGHECYKHYELIIALRECSRTCHLFASTEIFNIVDANEFDQFQKLICLEEDPINLKIDLNNELHCLTRDTVNFYNLLNSSVAGVDLVVHMNIDQFTFHDLLKIKSELFQKFKSVTLCLFDEAGDIEEDRNVHSHGSNCVSEETKRKVRAFEKVNGRPSNLRFDASCIIDIHQGVFPLLYYTTTAERLPASPITCCVIA